MARDVKAGVEITGKDSSSSAFQSLIGNIDKSEKKFKAFNDRMAPVGQGFKNVGSMALGAGTAIAGGVIALVAGAVNIAKGAQEEIDALADLSAATGLSVKTLSEYGYAAKLSGVEQAELDAGIKKFTLSMANFNIAGSATRKALRALSPEFAKNLAATKSTDEAYRLTIEYLAGISNETKRLQIAQKLFGKGSLAVNAITKQGKDRLRELINEGRKYGIVTDDMVDKAGAYGDAQDRFNTALQGLKRTVGVELMPALTLATEGIADFIAVNREDIGQGVAVLAQNLGEGIINLGNWIKENPDSIKNFISDAADAAATLVAGIKDVKTNWDDLSRLFGGKASRNEDAVAAAGVPVWDFVPTPEEIKKGRVDALRVTGDQDEDVITGKGAFNAVAGRMSMGAAFMPGARFGMSGGMAAGLTAITAPDRKIIVDLKVPKGMAPANKIVDDKAGVTIQIEESADDLLGHTWS